jgi:hypothetical protein
MSNHKVYPASPQATDRAAVVTTSIILVITESLRHWVRGDACTPKAARREIEDMLRDEFADLAHQMRGERDPPAD